MFLFCYYFILQKTTKISAQEKETFHQFNLDQNFLETQNKKMQGKDVLMKKFFDLYSIFVYYSNNLPHENNYLKTLSNIKAIFEGNLDNLFELELNFK